MQTIAVGNRAPTAVSKCDASAARGRQELLSLKVSDIALSEATLAPQGA